MPCGEDYFLSEREKNEKVSGKFLYAVTDFSIFKKDEAYWLEYIGNDTYVGRSDNILNQKVEIAPRHLVRYFSEKPRPAFEKELADWFYGMRTWGLDVGDVGCEAFCDSQAHEAAKRLLMYAPTLNDDDMSEEPDKGLDVTDFCKPIDPGIAQCVADHWWEMLDSKEPDKSLDDAAYKYSFDSRPCIYGQVDVIDAFKAGAEWQKEQMLKDAMESNVVITSKGILLSDLRIEDFNYEDKVRIIIVKED